ncbi:MAG: CDP-alcohol phosphatidyltransferase family protein [Candidatus Glassbacteria bacterium]|nr:CDP-alcohol phosphatidyltransferase family protein [Candidatus Glassbacteria bacterium]
MRFTPKLIIHWYIDLISPLIRFCIRHRVSPNLVTTIGFFFTVGAALAFAIDEVQWAGAILLFSGTFDIIDGKVARATGSSSKFGSFFDSTMDRLSDMIVYMGLLYLYLDSARIEMVWVIFAAIIGSLMVSYCRSKAEALGITCSVGLFQRPERVVYLGFGAILGHLMLYIVIWFLAIVSNLTMIQRIVHVYKAGHGIPLEDDN